MGWGWMNRLVAHTLSCIAMMIPTIIIENSHSLAPRYLAASSHPASRRFVCTPPPGAITVVPSYQVLLAQLKISKNTTPPFVTKPGIQRDFTKFVSSFCI